MCPNKSFFTYIRLGRVEINMENLEQYRLRTKGFMMDSIPHTGTFETSLILWQKVDKQGNFCPFAGDTIIFQLDDTIKNLVLQMQEALYQRCSNMLAVPIKPSAFHVTLHDLSNGKPSQTLSQKIEQNSQKVNQILEKIKEETRSIKVRTISIFNMVNTSVVLGLEPEDEDSCTQLMELHECFQMVVPLNYPLTLHITLGYYKPGTYSNEQREQLVEVFSAIRKNCKQVLELDRKELIYQRFDDMNQYY